MRTRRKTRGTEGILALCLGIAVLVCFSSCGRKESVRPPAAAGQPELPASVPSAAPPSAAPPADPSPSPPQAVPRATPSPALPRLEVASCRLAANGEFVEVRFRIRGKETLDPLTAGSYLLEEATGEKFYEIRLQRLGRPAGTRDDEEKGVHSLLFKNREGKLRPGMRITLTVGPLHRENVLLEE